VIRKSIPKKFRSFPVIFLLLSSIFLLLFATLPLARASSGIVQQNNGGCTSTGCSPSAISFPSSVTSGDVIVVAIASYGGTVISVSDTLLSSFSLAVSFSNYPNPMKTYIYYATLSSSGTDSVSVSMYFDNIQAGVYIYEVSGVTATGATTETGSGSCTSSPCTVATSSSATFQSGSFLLGVVGTPSTITTTAGSGFTLSSGSSGGTFGGYAEYSTGGVSSPTNFLFSVASSSITWAEAGIALVPLSSTSTSSTSSTATSTTTSSTTTSSTATAGFYNDQAASLVVGEPDFSSNVCASGSPTASTECDPYGVTFDSSHNLWVADEGNNRVLEYPSSSLTGNGPPASIVLGASSLTGGRCTAYITPTSSGDCLGDIREIVFNSAGDLFVADHLSQGIDVFNPPFSTDMNGNLALGGRGCTSNQSSICQPDGMAFDSSGNLWVTDGSLARVLEFTPPFSPGELASAVIGQPDFTSRSCVKSSAASLCGPKGLAFDGSGNLWVSDYGSDRVLEFKAPFTSGMSASLVIGNGSCTLTTSTSLCSPRGIAFDSSGNLWVADTGYNRVLEFAPPFTGGASIVLGQSDFTSELFPATSQSSFYDPEDLAFDASGNLWVSDNGNSRILEFLNSQTTTSTSTTKTLTTTSTVSSSSTTSTSTVSTTTTATIPRAHVSITINPDLTSNSISANNFFLVSYNDGAQEFVPQQGGTLQIEAAIGSQVSIAARSSASNSQEEWCLWGTSSICNPIQFTVASSGNTVTYTYYDLLSQLVSYAIHGGGNPNPPTLTFLTVASSANSQDNLGLSSITLSSSAQTIWALRTLSGARPIQLGGFGIINTSPPTQNEQWSAGFGTCCAILGPDVIPNPIVFYNQYSQQVSFSITGSGTGFSAPTLNYVSAGSAQTFTLTQNAFSLFLDAGSSWSVTPNPLAGSILGNSWKATSGTAGTVTGPGTIDPVYVEVFGQIAANLEESFGVGDTFAPSTQTPLSDGVSISDKYVAPSSSSLFDGIALKDTYVSPLTAPLFDGITVNDYLVSPVKAALNDLVGMGEKLASSSFLSVGVTFSGNIFFIVHSPVNILVTDTQGRQAGFNSTGSMINTIPGAQIIPKNGTQLETIIIPDPLSGQYTVEVFPVNGGGNYTIESQSTNANGTVVADTRQTGSVTSGSQYLGVTLTPSGQVTETPPSITPPFQNKSSTTTLIITVAVIAAAIAVAGSALFVLYRRKKQ